VKKLMWAALALAGGAAIFLLARQLRSNNVSPELSGTTASSRINLSARVDSSVRLFWRIPDFRATGERMMAGPLGAILTDSGLTRFIAAKLFETEPDKATGALTRTLDSIRSMAVAVGSEDDWAVAVEISPEGVQAFRDLLALVCSRPERPMYLEKEGDMETLRIEGSEARTAIHFRETDDVLILSSSASGMSLFSLEDREDKGLQREEAKAAQGAGFDVVGLGKSKDGTWSSSYIGALGKDGEKWSIHVGRRIIPRQEIEGSAQPGLAMFGDGYAGLSIDNAVIEALLLDGEKGEIFSRLAEQLRPLRVLAPLLSAGKTVAVLGKGSQPGEFVLSIPVHDEKAAISEMNLLAEEAKLEVRTSEIDPPVTYLKDKEARIGEGIFRFRFWATRRGRLYLSSSQFSLLNLINSEQDSTPAPANATAHVFVDLTALGRYLLPMASLMTVTQSDTPDLAMICDKLGMARATLLEETDRTIIEGEGAVPFGLLLHILLADYN